LNKIEQKMALRGKKKLMIEALKKNLGSVTHASRLIGIGRTTHYYWLNTDSEYKKEAEEIEDYVTDMVENALYNKILVDKDTQCIIFYLKTKGAKRGYIERRANLNLNLNKSDSAKSMEEIWSEIQKKKKKSCEEQ
jgi:hypothetical protein